MLKKTFEEVEAAFNQRGFTLLSKDYISSKSPLKYLCDNGHQTKISFGNLQSGKGCLDCSGNKKKTLEEVRIVFESKGYTLLSTEYKNNESPLNYLCSNEHKATIRLADLQRGTGCSSCAGLKKKTLEEVRELFTARGYTLLSDHYINSKLPLDYICCNGHLSLMSFHSLQQGIGCAECSGLKKKTLEEVRELFTAREFTLLSTEYKNCRSLLNYICTNGHQSKISFGNLQSGKSCAECSFDSKRKTIEEVRELFTARNYTLLSTEYKGAHSLLNYICGKGHQTKISFNSLQSGSGCSSCAETGFNPNKFATLYYIRFQFEGNFYYKIGITNNTPSKRFQSEKTPYTIVKETTYTLGRNALLEEQAILKKFSAYRYKGKPFLTMRGDTELFIKDVLQLDDSILKIKPFQNFAA